MKKILLSLGIVAIIFAAWFFMQPKAMQNKANQMTKLDDLAMVAVTLPAQFNEQEQMGNRAFDAACAACHGVNGQGKTGVAPPLVHPIYEPNHHGDMAFIMAAENGVRSHHWPFGDMPPVQGVTAADVMNIVAYIRALQRTNGIN
jgi:cytochrome c